METIFVTYSGIPAGFGRFVYHKAIHYVNETGEEQVIEAFPEKGSSGSSGPGGYGKILPIEGPVKPQQKFLPRETIITDVDLNTYWAKIQKRSREVADEGYI